MKFILLLALLATGCAQTRIYENGQLVAAIQADATNVTIRTPRGTYFHADVINHSAPGAAAGTAWSGVIGGAVNAVVTGVALF